MPTVVDFSPNHLLVFAREPVLGRVKTRLAVDIGPEAALAVYRELLGLTATAVAAAQVPATVWLAEAPAGADPAAPRPEWPGLPWRVQPAAESLGERMSHAFGEAFAAGAARAVIIGTDCPGLTPALLRAAFEALNAHDVVVGPADDGGYYLLGLRELQPALFANKNWSTATVLPDTLADAARLGLSVAQLPMLHDVDSGRDLATWRGSSNQ
ncbi:TIGR04282 family arsenosugar biosynthesis glycosyltransferase [Hymenobacter properus]|uniref:TIGR04282 family arsenosugar biosynthesis glycosyltransferase n=1 Tax=Hymenobacter properus TaxID=2791026 RepID=A0A931BHM3_9BACT|nr:TIGR04282 family arsenosugar biosynthesis glycosyltransferase [Hymenobacter properus]MBF9142523.1 TIGR04282 family arsenosugar biosynthesis glycosyltransferase [Hymenobacter properus]MBR7721330.1 TIGR04282 family arsenosugar biosynthesis glycosyltransferase [Microvirga sp. SRT04]